MSESDSAQYYLESGRDFYGKGEFGKACDSYKKAIEKAGSDNMIASNAHHGLGQAYYKLKDYASAKDSLISAIKSNSGNAAAYNNLGEVYHKGEKNYAEAIEAFKKAIEIDHDYADAHNNLGEVYYKGEKNYAEAIEAFKKAIEIDHDYATAYNNLGEVYYKLKEYDKAENYFDIAIKKMPNLLDAYHNKSKILYYHKKDYFKAIETLEKITKADNADLRAYSNIAYILWKQARYKEAREAYKDACKVGEKLFAVKSFSKDEFKKQYATIEELCCEIDAAISSKANVISLNAPINTIEWLNELLKHPKLYTLFPNEGFSSNNKEEQDNIIIRNRLLLEKNLPQYTPKSHTITQKYFEIYGKILHTIFGKLSEAEEIYKKGRDLHPKSTGILIGLFKLYIDKRENDDDKKPFAHHNALDVYRKAKELLENLRRDGEYRTFWQLGLLLMEMEEYEKAKDCLQAAIKICNDRPDPHVNLGILYIRVDDLPRAIQCFKDALKLDPDDLTIQSNLAGAYLRRGLVKNAEIEYRKILRITQNHIESQIGLGYVYLSLGDNDIDMYNQAIQHFAEGLELTKSDNVSKRLTKKEIADIYYSRGCAYVELSKSDKNKVLLHNALKDFKKCRKYDENNHDAIRAVKKIKIRFGQMSIEKAGTRAIWVSSLAVFVLSHIFIILEVIPCTKDLFTIPIAFYPILTFGSLIFMIAGFFLPYLTKLKFSVIELEKAPIDNIITSNPLEVPMPMFKG